MSLKTIIFRIFITGFLVSALWSCGQAGPLYLPKDVEAETNQQAEQNQDPQTESIPGRNSANPAQPVWQQQSQDEQ